MDEKVKPFLENVILTVVNDVVSGDAATSRLAVSERYSVNKVGIVVSSVDLTGPVAKISPFKVEKYQAQSCDPYSGIVPAAPEFRIVGESLPEFREALVQYFLQRFSGKDFVEVTITPVAVPGKPAPAKLVGNSDKGGVEVYIEPEYWDC